MHVPAPAKVNLTLCILGKRPDGYHALESVMQMLDLEDTLVITEADAFTFTCSEPGLAGHHNLVVKAARLLQEYSPLPRGAHVHLEKRIPTQAGLGGGSSDAAAALEALNEFWGIRLPMEELTRLAVKLGSDVPFFLSGPCSTVRGRGEDVTPVLHQAECHVVLVKPGAGLATADVYGQVRASATACAHTDTMLAALEDGSPAAIAAALSNDLEEPAFHLLPALRHGKARLLEQGCLGAVLCGSGSALCGICPDANTAAHAALDLTNDFPWTTAARFLLPSV
jgi:4-diphosphocytidyl-2-C-methyl-D-erythritol kinase